MRSPLTYPQVIVSSSHLLQLFKRYQHSLDVRPIFFPFTGTGEELALKIKAVNKFWDVIE